MDFWQPARSVTSWWHF